MNAEQRFVLAERLPQPGDWKRDVRPHILDVYKLQEKRTGFLGRWWPWKTVHTYYGFNAALAALLRGEISQEQWGMVFGGEHG
ncbi:MAG: hypothetical protein ABFE07_28465 [Armatimonadia bacterium]